MIIWLASYPKSGNTWVRSIVNQLAFNDIKKNEDVFDGLIKIRKYPTTYDMPKLTKISDLHSDDQKKELVIYTIKNWKESQDRIYKKKNFIFLKLTIHFVD